MRAQLLFVFTVICLLVSFASASNICSCECCSGSRCAPAWNTTASIDSCWDCTRSYCKHSFTACSNKQDISVRCINRDSIANKLMIGTFLGCIGVLLVIGCLKNHIPFFQSLVSRANEKPKVERD